MSEPVDKLDGFKFGVLMVGLGMCVGGGELIHKGVGLVITGVFFVWLVVVSFKD